MTQKFKGDTSELAMEAAGATAFDLVSLAQDRFFDGCYETEDFLLSLYDNGRMPFSDRVPRDAFVSFIKQAIPNFPFTGTFEAYIFIIKSIFGADAEILFEVPAAGQLEIVINSSASLEFDWIATEFVDGSYINYEMTTMDGDFLQFRGISGITSQAQLNQLLSELIPAGIYPSITLQFFTLSSFVVEDPDTELFLLVDSSGNQIVFFELGA